VDEWIALLTPMVVLSSIVVQRRNSAQVKVALEDATAKSDEKLSTIHGLVNGNMTEQKRVTMMQAKRIASLTNDPSDHALAIDAQRSYEDHLARQQTAIAQQIPMEHRVLLSDGPAVKMILSRLESIEIKLASLKCVGGECPTTDAPPALGL
jgi:hypothetical protein